MGLSLAVLIYQRHEVVALDLDARKVDMLNKLRSPIQDEQIEEFLATKEVTLQATLDRHDAYEGEDFMVIAIPTDCDPQTNLFNTGSVEAVVREVQAINPRAVMVIKSTIPVGYTVKARARFQTDNLIFSPEFLREGSSIRDYDRPPFTVVGANSEAPFELLQSLFGSDDEGAVFFLVSRGLAMREAAHLRIMDAGRNVGSMTT